MVREVISLQVGQCGNQVGFEFWKNLCKDHGIGPDGAINDPSNQRGDLKDSFFYQDDNGRYVPRALLMDLEPRVVNKIFQSEHKDLFSSENKIMSDGAGAGNIWNKGYEFGKKLSEDVLDIIDSELENTDNAEGFFLFHSVAGGTGSGMGSYLIQCLADRYPKMIIQTYSVFPNTLETSDVVVQPYNVTLTMRALTEYADAVIVLDNSALNRIAAGMLKKTNPDLDVINQLICCVTRASTATLRYPGYMNADLRSIVASLVISPRCNLITTSYAPFTLKSGDNSSSVKKISLFDVMRRLLLQKNMLATTDMHSGRYLSLIDMIQGEVDPGEIHKNLMKIRERSLIQFAEWVPAQVQVIHSHNSPYISNTPKISGLMLSNYTGIRLMLKRLAFQFDALYKKGAFVDQFRRESEDGDCAYAFEDARDTMQSVLDEYEDIVKSNYV